MHDITRFFLARIASMKIYISMTQMLQSDHKKHQCCLWELKKKKHETMSTF